MSTAWIKSKAMYFLFIKNSHNNNKDMKDLKELWLKISQLEEVSGVSFPFPKNTNVGGLLYLISLQGPTSFSNAYRYSRSLHRRLFLEGSDGDMAKSLGSDMCPTK